MNCEKCKRTLAEAEPVYRLCWDARVGWRMVCAACEVSNSKADAARGLAKYPPWLPPRPCCHCSRPVFRDREHESTTYFVCGVVCRQAIHNANYRYGHPRLRVERQCGSCGNAFKPKRKDAKFCSVACKQRTYRRMRAVKNLVSF
ncbi:hypothetical protein AC629_42265 [Bradyrhizobium sp. NAS80.1]|nr:hypothetical protein AC629_42265 [Bradyrhizobium sp. NAS80.1]